MPEGEAAAEEARRKAALRLGSTQARLAAQGSDLLGSPVDVLGDIRAGGEGDALSLRYRGMRDAWEHRRRSAARQAGPTGSKSRQPQSTPRSASRAPFSRDADRSPPRRKKKGLPFRTGPSGASDAASSAGGWIDGTARKVPPVEGDRSTNGPTGTRLLARRISFQGRLRAPG